MQDISYKNFIKISFWFLHGEISAPSRDLSPLWKHRQLSHPRLLWPLPGWFSLRNPDSLQSLRNAHLLRQLWARPRHPSGCHDPLFQFQSALYSVPSRAVLCRPLYCGAALWKIWHLTEPVLSVALPLEIPQTGLARAFGGSLCFWPFFPQGHPCVRPLLRFLHAVCPAFFVFLSPVSQQSGSCRFEKRTVPSAGVCSRHLHLLTTRPGDGCLWDFLLW